MIAVNDLKKTFESNLGNVEAVRGVTFNVFEGEVYGLLGPNGAGKTTTIRMILGLLSPTSGNSTIDGYCSTDQPLEVRRRVGIVSANSGVYPYLSAYEMLLYFADLYAVPRQQAKDEVNRLSQLLGMNSFIHQLCSTLSTGQRQRVNLARALVHRPAVVLLDEPTLGLDIVGSKIVSEFIDHLKDEGKAVILSTHRLDDAERLCSRFGLMHRGLIVAEGTLAELRERTGYQDLANMFFHLAEIGPMLSRTDRSDKPSSNRPGVGVDPA